ncbi:aminoacyl-tRNA hydrolase [Malassezia nana]|uniref:Aminoacyl-tRNA hydrolase n=1 Tax=Malassezia nana TaxID=180528 RepID=A0AAF0EQ87_9BASI|nr:aminoacyl-tRNA hydrolase [Malassezia nana]
MLRRASSAWARVWVPVGRSLPFYRPVHTYEVDWSNDEERRRWLEEFRACPLQTGEVHIGYARSSGPGGQNVNKCTLLILMEVHTKVHARLDLGPRTSRPLPTGLVKALAKQSPMYIQATHSLQVASERYRSQAQNVQDALSKVR